MYILVRAGDSITDFYRQFHAMFPFLKLELIRANSIKNQAGVTGIGAGVNFVLVNKNKEQTILITPETKFTDLAAEFTEIFGVTATLYRKIGKSWIKTNHTNSWALSIQNDQGREISGLLKDIPEEN